MKEKDYSKVESQDIKNYNNNKKKNDNDNKKIFVFISLLLLLIAAILTTGFIICKSKPSVPSSSGASKPAPAPASTPAPAPASTPAPAPASTPAPAPASLTERLYLTRELFPGLFSLDKTGLDLKSHLKDKYPGFIYNMKRSGDKMGFNNETDQEICIYDIKTETIQVINFDGIFCGFNENQTKVLVSNYQSLFLIDLVTKESKEIFKLAHNNITDVSYSNDWKYIYYCYYDGNNNFLYRVDAADGSNLVLIHDLPHLSSVLFLWDGKKFAYIVQMVELHLFDIESKKNEMIFSITEGKLHFLSSEADDLYLYFKDDGSNYDSVYKFNIIERNFELFEKSFKLEADADADADIVKGKKMLDIRPFFVQQTSSGESLCTVDEKNELNRVLDNSLIQNSIMSKITPLRYDSKIIYKANDLFLYDLVKKNIEVLMRPVSSDFAVSPSGNRIALYTSKAKAKLEVFDIEKKTLVFSKDSINLSLSCSFSHDGQSIYFLVLKGVNYFLYKMDALTGEKEELILNLGTNEVLKLSISPDGLGAVFVRQSNTNSTLVYIDFKAGATLVEVDLYTTVKNSFSIISWNNTTIYLEARDPTENEYFLYEIDLKLKIWKPVMDKSHNKIHIHRI
jgi:WD40 repeat protein